MKCKSFIYRIEGMRDGITLIPDLTESAVSLLETRGFTREYYGFPDVYKVVAKTPAVTDRVEQMIWDITMRKAEELYKLGKLEETRCGRYSEYRITITAEEIEDGFVELIAGELGSC